MNLTNYLIPSVNTPLNQKHIPADKLKELIEQHDGSEAYHSLFDLEPREDFKSYSGIMRPAMKLVWLDFDDKDASKPQYQWGQKALEDVREFLKNLKIDDLYIFFSGSKGFHIGIPQGYFGFEPSADLSKKLKQFLTNLKTIYKTADSGIFEPSRKFRVPGSKHPKTGLYKIPLTIDELMMSELAMIRDYATIKSKVKLDSIDLNEDRKINNYIQEIFNIKPQQKQYTQNEKIKKDTDKQSLEFASFKKKKCIESLLSGRIPDGEKHYTSIILISDMFNTYIPKEECVKQMTKWWKLQSGEEKLDSGVFNTINDIYSKNESTYAYGCNNEIKKARCTGTCKIYKHLSKDTRPKVVDAPKDSNKINEVEVAQAALDLMENKIVRFEKNLFVYSGTHWIELDSVGVDKIKNKLNEACGNSLPSKDVDSLFRAFMRLCPSTDKNMFVPNSTCANFLDGTLHIQRDLETGKYTKEFLPHNPKDYLTWVVPVCYNGDHTHDNKLFMDMLDQAFEGDEDKDGKIIALRQMAGAMLIPCFPQLFFLWGASGARKSTIVKTLLKPLTLQNVSMTDPSNMKNHEIEAMIGKLVNANTDIDDDVPLNRGFIKKFEDNLPYEVNRKGRPVIKTKLPGVHVYCANKLPPNFEGSSKAMQRRVTLIEFTKDLTNNDMSKVIRYYEDIVYNSDPHGVVNFMVKGIDDIIANDGKFTQILSSRLKLDDWQSESNALAKFVKDLKSDEGVPCWLYDQGSEKNVQYTVRESLYNDRIQKPELWRIFKYWYQEEYSTKPVKHYNKSRFYVEFSKVFECKKIGGNWFFFGLKMEILGNYNSPNSENPENF